MINRRQLKAAHVRWMPGAFIACMMLLHGFTFAQHIEPTSIATLPEEIPEASGMEHTEAGLLWLINDSGHPAELLALDPAGNWQRTVSIAGVSNWDFEDLCRDAAGNMYVGDFGNNRSDRRNLKILKISGNDLEASDTVSAETIRFSFPDQSAFPPGENRMDFDCEAFIHSGTHLYLFSKNRSSAYTRLYQLPDQPGSYKAVLLDSFQTGGWITAADISPDGQRLALLSEDHIWVFSNFSGIDFFSGLSHKISFEQRQFEAMVFRSDSTLFLADEREENPDAGNLYSLGISHILRFSAQHLDNPVVVPNPFSSEAQLYLSDVADREVNLTVYTTAGIPVLERVLAPNMPWVIQRGNLADGHYIYRIMDENTLIGHGRFEIMGSP